MKTNYSVAIVALIISVLVPENAWAYLDPGAGASLIAILAGGFTGIIVLMKMWRAKLAQMFGRKNSPPPSTEETKRDSTAATSKNNHQP